MTAESDWRALLEGVDLSGLDGNNWQIKENPFNLFSSEGEFKRYDLSNGLVTLDMGMDKDATVITWDAQLPSYLIPDNSLNEDRYIDFSRRILMIIPTILYPKKQPAWKYRDDYIESSKVIIEFQDGRQDAYRFSNERENLALAVNFVARGDEIGSMLIIGKEEPGFKEFKYMLRIDRYKNQEARVALGIPTLQDSLGVWNSGTLGWILGTHKEKSKLGNLPYEAKALSELIQEKAQEGVAIWPISEEKRQP